MRTAAIAFGSRAVAVVLTGLGRDGTQGSQFVRAAGGAVLVQEPAECVAPFMPRSVIEAGAADEVVPLGELAARVENRLGSLRAAPH